MKKKWNKEKKKRLQIPTGTFSAGKFQSNYASNQHPFNILLNKSFLTWRSFTRRQSLIRSCISWNFLGHFFSFKIKQLCLIFYMWTFFWSLFISQKTNVWIFIKHQLKLLENFIRDRSRNIWSHILFKCSMPV